MKANARTLLAAAVVILAAGHAATTLGADPAKPITTKEAAGATTEPASVDSLVVSIRHRVFHDFRDFQEVVMDDVFVIGDGEYAARIMRFVPDFALNFKTHEVISRSPEPNNPAFQIEVFQDEGAVDTSWAFFNRPPHYSKKSMLAFQVLRIDFSNGDRLIVPDSVLTHLGVKP